MRALHFGLRVTDRARSVAFYEVVGYQVVGSVPETGIGHLTMLSLPGDDFVTLELVHDPATPFERGTALSHFVVQVDSMTATLEHLAEHGIEPVEPEVTHDDGMRTAHLADPDGHRIELVQWPPGHPDGITAADWPEHAPGEENGNG